METGGADGAPPPRGRRLQRLDPQAPLALLLLRASRWFDAMLLDRLQNQGWPRLSPAQSLVFAYLDHTGTPPAELARRMGQSRQATAQLIAGLATSGLLTVIDDPHRRRGRLVVPTARGLQLASAAAAVHAELENELGSGPADALRGALAALPWDLTRPAPDAIPDATPDPPPDPRLEALPEAIPQAALAAAPVNRHPPPQGPSALDDGGHFA